MQVKSLIFIYFIVFIVSSAVLPDPSLRSLPSNSDFATARQRIQNCKKSKCPTTNYPKFKDSKSLRDYVQAQYAKLKSKVSIDQASTKFAEFSKKIGRPETETQKQIKLSRANILSQKASVRSINPKTKEFPKSLLRIQNNAQTANTFAEGSINSRLLQSQNNQYPQWNQGNLQANHGNKCLYKVKWDSNTASHHITVIYANGINLISPSSIWFSNNYYVQQIHATNNFLVVIGTYWDTTNTILVYKIPINPVSCALDFKDYAYYQKRGNLAGSSRERNGRLLIVSQEQFSNHDYDWTIYQFGNFGTYQANNFGFVSGESQNVIRSVWNIPISNIQNDFYFQQFYFADWSYTINIQASNILYITSQSWIGSNTFNVQAIQSAITNPFGSYSYTGNYPGYVTNSRFQDQYGDVFRVLTNQWTQSAGNIVYAFQFTVPDLNLLSQDDVTYNQQYLTSSLFVNDYAYLVYQNIIRAAFLVGGSATFTDFPMASGDSVQFLFKFQNGWIVGFGSTTSQSQPIVNLYRISSVSPILTLTKRYQLTLGPAITSVDIWNAQGFLINPATNTIAFNLYNLNTAPAPPAVMTMGLYYLYVHTNGCIGPLPLPATCPPGPPPQPFGPVYKHYPSGTYQTGQSQYVERFTILQQNGQSYLYSSSNGQMQARKISQTNNLPQIFAPTSSAVFL